MVYRDSHFTFVIGHGCSIVRLCFYEQKKKSWDFLLLYIDLRNFRTVNNQLSHAAGNEVLKEFYALFRN